jgi:hypothetical protein
VWPTALGSSNLSWRTILFKEKPAGMTYALYANDGSAHPDAQVSIGGEQNAAGPSSLPLNAWSHLAAVYDGQTLRLYVNGNLAASKPQTGSAEVSSGALRIGGNSVWSEWFKGAIDEVRVYDRALSVDEVKQDMTTPVGSTVAPSQPAALLGDRQVETDLNPEPAGVAEAFPSVASAAGALRTVNVYVDATSTATTLFAGVYSDAGGHPGTLLGESDLETPIAGEWNSIALPAVSVAAGATYWLAILAPDGTFVFRDRCCTVAGGGPTETSAQRTLRGLPGTWSTGTVYDDAPMSIYATG